MVYFVSTSGDIPVRDFLDRAKPKLKTKTLRILMTVQEYGLQAVAPHVKKLTGTPLWEIRILGTDNVRILFVAQVGKQVLLLHAFYKKSQKTPIREIAVALARLKEYRNS